jgi:hypothetical protein
VVCVIVRGKYCVWVKDTRPDWTATGHSSLACFVNNMTEKGNFWTVWASINSSRKTRTTEPVTVQNFRHLWVQLQIPTCSLHYHESYMNQISYYSAFGLCHKCYSRQVRKFGWGTYQKTLVFLSLMFCCKRRWWCACSIECETHYKVYIITYYIRKMRNKT